MNFAAVIFDMDGVLIDSEPLWEKADYHFFKEHIPNLPEYVVDEYRGQSHSGVNKFFIQKFGLQMSLQEFIEHRNEYSLREIYAKAFLQPGIKECLSQISGAKIPLAIGTSSVHAAANMACKTHGLENIFETIVTSEDVHGLGKPAPDIYLLAAKKLGISPKDCLVIEDAPVGIAAGKSAGMTVYAYRYEGNKDDDLSAADKIIHSFQEIF